MASEEPKLVNGGEAEAEAEAEAETADAGVSPIISNGIVSAKDETLGPAVEDRGGSKEDVVMALGLEVEKLNKERAGLRGRVEELQEEIRLSDVGNQTNAAHAAELEAEVSRIQHDLVTAQCSVADFEAEVRSLKTVVENLEAEKALLSDSKASLKCEIKALEARIGDLAANRAAEVESLRAVIEELKAKGSAFELEVKRIEELEKTVKKLEEEKSELQDRASNLQLEMERSKDLPINGENDASSIMTDSQNRLRVSWPAAATATMSAGAIAAAVTAIYLRHVRQR